MGNVSSWPVYSYRRCTFVVLTCIWSSRQYCPSPWCIVNVLFAWLGCCNVMCRYVCIYKPEYVRAMHTTPKQSLLSSFISICLRLTCLKVTRSIDQWYMQQTYSSPSSLILKFLMLFLSNMIVLNDFKSYDAPMKPGLFSKKGIISSSFHLFFQKSPSSNVDWSCFKNGRVSKFCSNHWATLCLDQVSQAVNGLLILEALYGAEVVGQGLVAVWENHGEITRAVGGAG